MGSLDSYLTMHSGMSNSRLKNDFANIEFLGKGGFGTVFKAKNKLDGHEYAIKGVPILPSIVKENEAIREVQALANLDHPNIIRYYNAWKESSKLHPNFGTSWKSIRLKRNF